MIIDFHVHCFPDELAKRAVPLLAAKAGFPARLDGTIAALKESMSNSGITRSVIQSIATKPDQSRSITQWSQSIECPCITAFSSVHPDSPDWREDVDAIKNAGLKGIKFHPDYQEFFVDDLRMFPIYERIFSHDLIVLFHAGVDIGLKPPYHCTPERLRKVVRSFAGARIVAAHTGGFRYWDDVERYLAGEDLWLDTSYTIGWAEDDQVRRIIKSHGYDKILFATDSPWAGQDEEAVKFKKLKLDSQAEDAILYKNAHDLLRIQTSSDGEEGKTG